MEKVMEKAGNAFIGVSERMKQALLNEEIGDYIGAKDELIYCGLYNTPKQQISIIPEVSRKMIENHTGREEKLNKESDRWKDFERMSRIAELREEAFDDRLLSEQTFRKDDGSLEHERTGQNYVEKFEEMEKENIGLLFTGPVGTGKTFLASAIANALIEREISVKMTNFAIILNDMMNLEINKNKYITNLNEYRLLIIDDFGMERDTPFATEHIFNVIDSRYRANKPIILTTNLSATKLTAPSNLKEQRVYSRILEMAVPIVFSGENKRIVKMKEKVRKANTLLING